MLRIATFNVENLDDTTSRNKPPLAVRLPILQRKLKRLDADILCLQEVHAQENPDHSSSHPSRALLALDQVVADTEYAGFQRAHTRTAQGMPYDKRNLVVLSRYPITSIAQYRNDHIDELQYRRVTAQPADDSAREVRWERPILHVQINVPELGNLHMINLHLKSRLATPIPGQGGGFSWKNAAAWAEGYFMSSMKRVGQALETRLLIDQIFDQDEHAHILVCGDFNAEPGEVPVEAICGRIENTNNVRLLQRELLACSQGIPESVRFSHLHHGQANLLDHMVASKALFGHFAGARLLNESLRDESLPSASDNKFPEADHAPFVAQFDI